MTSPFDSQSDLPMILVVDDELRSRESLRRVLDQEFQVLLAESARAQGFVLEQAPFAIRSVVGRSCAPLSTLAVGRGGGRAPAGRARPPPAPSVPPAALQPGKSRLSGLNVTHLDQAPMSQTVGSWRKK